MVVVLGSGRTQRAAALVVLWSQFSDLLTDSPDLHVSDGDQLLLKFFSVVDLGVEVQGSLGLGTVSDRGVQLLENRLQVLLEDWVPVQGTSSGSGGARVVHVVHTVLTNQWV